MKKALSIFLSALMFLAVIPASVVPAIAAESLPTSYTSAYTPARNQGNSNMCWAFSATAVLEANILKNSGRYTDEQLAAMIPSGVYDKSRPLADQIDFFEKAIAYYHYNALVTDPADPTRGDFSDEAGKQSYEKGGHANALVPSLARWSGPASYDDTTPLAGEPLYYNYSSLWVNEGVPETSRYTSVAHLQHAVTISNNLANRDELIKQNIMECGAVAIGYTNASGGYNETTDSSGNKLVAFYGNGQSGNGHAVAIVGWDDSFSKDNFKADAKPARDGAWLCKNSYGTDWGMGGLFWMSYDEASIASATSFYLDPPNNYDNNYQYDGNKTNTGSSSYETMGVNVFTAKKDEILEAVSFYPTTENGDTSNYTVSVYKNFTAFEHITNADFSGVTLPAPDSLIQGTTNTDSYITLKLQTPLVLKKGEKYAVAVQDTHSSRYYYQLDNCNNNAGESYIVRMGNEALDLYNDGKGVESDKSYRGYLATIGGNLAIKAFTSDLDTQSTALSYTVDPSYTVTIPETVTLGETETISVENVVVDEGKQVNIKLTATSGTNHDFTVATAKGATLTYSITKDGNPVAIGDAVLSVNPATAAAGSSQLAFSTPAGAKYPGTYTGTVTFTISVDDAA